ncbi:MAG: hypothetical protein HY880_00805 [Deltaproteobacteria bacterium]|nr:hypothetical protein [Deltaproteobacteria bacterium]
MSKVTIGEFKGKPTISLPLGTVDKEGQERNFTFGVKKAQAILEYIEDIKKFVEANKQGK